MQETRTADEMIAYYRDMSESEYERLKEKVWKGAKTVSYTHLDVYKRQLFIKRDKEDSVFIVLQFLDVGFSV